MLMLQNIFPENIRNALRLSVTFWVLGLIAFIPFLFLGFNLPEGLRVILIIEPFLVLILSGEYLRRTNSKYAIKEGALFGLFLVITHMPADALFILLFFKEGLILFKTSLGIFFYGEMMLFSAIAGLLHKEHRQI